MEKSKGRTSTGEKGKRGKDKVEGATWDESSNAELKSFIQGLGFEEHNEPRKRKRLAAPGSADAEGGSSAVVATTEKKKKKKSAKKDKPSKVSESKELKRTPKVDRAEKAPLDGPPNLSQEKVEDFLKQPPRQRKPKPGREKETGRSKVGGGGGGGMHGGSLSDLRKKLRVPLSSVWHDDAGTAAKAPKGVEVDLDTASALQQEAAALLVEDTSVAEEMHTLEYGSEEAWMKTILKDGTLGDKLAAWMLRVQESPVHRLQALDALLGYTTKRKREVLEAVDTLRELWIINLLPERKLIRWVERPFGDLPEVGKRREELLILWHYEGEIKVRYERFIDVLEGMCHDQLPEVKTKVLGTVSELLSTKAEQEQRLLGTICNKLGDPHPKVSGKAQFYLKQLVARHPNIKTVVTKEVQHVLNRPNVGEKPQYAVMTFLNQLELSRSDSDVELAKRLIDLYFQFFDAATKDGELGSKLLSAVLTGVNRAHPFAGISAEFFQKYSGVLFKMVHTGSFNCSIQALLLLCQVLEGSTAVSDRYVRAVYAKILDPELLTSSKQGMFLNVVFRTMKMDPSLNRVKAYVKRMLQVCSAGAPAGFICGALYMLSQVAKKRPEIMAMINLPEDIDGGEENFKDAPDSDEEDEEGKDEDEGDKEDMETDARRGPANASVPNGGAVAADGYDPRKREPQFCGAEQTCLWELVPLLAHHHPSVAAFAGSFKSGKAVQYTGDPLRDFVLLRFLDKFVYKKPKAKPSDRGGSVMQPKRGETDMDLVNTADFLKKDPSQIPEHELFFYQYFTHRAAKSNLNEDAAMAEVEAGAAAAPMADFAHEIAPDAFADDDDDDDDVGDFEGDPDEDAMYAALAAGDFEDEFDDDENDDDLDDFGGSASDSDEESSEPSKKGADAKKVDLDLGGSVFASAEDFAHMIEEDTGSQEKQSKWEGKQGRGDQRNPREGKPSRGDKQSRAEPKSFKPGASRRRPSKRARMTKRA